MPLPPGFTEVSQSGPPAGFSEESPDFGAVVKMALNEARMGDGSKMRALMSDPITQAKVLPLLAGGALGVMGVPMGATAGTGAGHLLADAALKSYGREDEIPSTGRQLMDTGLAAAGDLTAIPAVNRKIFGGQVGQAERAARFPDVKDIPSKPMALGQKTLGEFINEAFDDVGKIGDNATPTFWKQIKDQTDRIYKLGKDQALTTLDQGRLKFLSAQAQRGLNGMAPGRAAAASDLAMSQAVPNAIGKATRTLPWWAKAGMVSGATASGVGGLAKVFGDIGTKR